MGVLFGVENIQITVMHYCSTSPICQLSKNNIKFYLNYTASEKPREMEELANIFAFIIYFTLLLG